MKKVQDLGIIMSVFVTLCSSCAVANSDSISEIPLCIYEKIKPMSNLTTPSLFVQLKDCGSSSVIADVDRIICWEDYVYIFDDGNDVITSYDMEGRMKMSTQKYKGHGRNEYIHLSDMAFDETNGLIYALCDTPSEIIIFDKNLEIRSIHPIDFMPIEMCVDSTHIVFLRSNYNKNCYEILTLEKGHLNEPPIVILNSEIAVKRIMGMGRSLTCTNGECWVSLPFDNCIYNIFKGKVRKKYCINFQEMWYKNDNNKAQQFLKKNSDKVWSIQNVQKCNQYLWFNTNTEGLYCIDTEKEQCLCYDLIVHDSIPYASQLIVPQQGLLNKVSFSIMPSFIYSYIRNFEKDCTQKTENRVYELAKNNIKEKNALVMFWEMK